MVRLQHPPPHPTHSFPSVGHCWLLAYVPYALKEMQCIISVGQYSWTWSYVVDKLPHQRMSRWDQHRKSDNQMSRLQQIGRGTSNFLCPALFCRKRLGQDELNCFRVCFCVWRRAGCSLRLLRSPRGSAFPSWICLCAPETHSWAGQLERKGEHTPVQK